VASYKARKHLEMLKDTSQLSMVYAGYKRVHSDLPEVPYDYTTDRDIVSKFEAIEDARTESHFVDIASAGNADADVILVGDNFAERKDNDAFYQWPFASFNRQGCSQWLTLQLELGGISESHLMWVNADQNLEPLHAWLETSKVIALGSAACEKLNSLNIHHHTVYHPQYQKRFGSKTFYQLIELLQG